MKSYLDSLAILHAAHTSTTYNPVVHSAALHLIAQQVVSANPIPPPAVCDEELRLLEIDVNH